MKWYMLTLLSFSLSAMQLQRTFSTDPLRDSLKCALMDNDESLPTKLTTLLPIALDRQYALLGLPLSEAARLLLLGAIEEYWYCAMLKSPRAGIESLTFGLRRLNESYGLSLLQSSFTLMLNRLKKRLLLSQLPKVLAVVDEMPSFEKLPRLQSLIASFLVGEQLEQPYRSLCEGIKPPIRVDLPLTRH